MFLPDTEFKNNYNEKNYKKREKLAKNGSSESANNESIERKLNVTTNSHHKTDNM